jgi:hypothetical protein
MYLVVVCMCALADEMDRDAEWVLELSFTTVLRQAPEEIEPRVVFPLDTGKGPSQAFTTSRNHPKVLQMLKQEEEEEMEEDPY